MCELFNKKVIQALGMANHSGKVQALCVNAVGSYDITPLERCNGAAILMSIGPSEGGRISDWQLGQFLEATACPKVKLTREDIGQAIYALAYHSAECQVSLKAIGALEGVINTLDESVPKFSEMYPPGQGAYVVDLDTPTKCPYCNAFDTFDLIVYGDENHFKKCSRCGYEDPG
jgi:hypothetical protein